MSGVPRHVLAFLIFLFFVADGLAQTPAPCPAPPQPSALRAPNIFNEQQEMDLGDAIAEQFQKEFKVIELDEMNGYVQRISDRLAQKMPWSKTRFRVFVFDLPMVNAFGFPGGRIYLSRKLIAAARNEDEIAGVIAHEMGHIVTRQVAVEMTAAFQEVLGVTSVGDRSDILEKYHQLIENARKGKMKKRSDREEQKEQLEADQAGMFAAAATGYSPQAYADFWNRVFDVKGKTGSWVSDFFGFTKPESRRLRDMLRFVATMPAACAKTATASAGFEAWKASVVAYSGLGRKESLHNVLTRRVLEPPLQSDLNHLRFSPDGKYALAQDDSSIFVLRREPFQSIFSINVEEAEPAQFTPDSKSIVFFNDSLRVEKWDIEEQERTTVSELVIQKSCVQAALSPGGDSLVCMTTDMDLRIYDVATSAEKFSKKNFYTFDFFEYWIFQLNALLGNEARLFQMNFSPDGKYLLVARRATNIAIDMESKAPMQLPGSVKKLLGRSFTFLGPDKLIGVGGLRGEKTAIVKFPTGEPLGEVAVGSAMLHSPSHGDYILLRPIAKYPVGVMNLATKKIFIASHTTAFDIYDKVYLSERNNGELGLYNIDSDQPLGHVQLPRAPFGRLRAVAASDDLNWLAVSQRSRGAVWNLPRNQRIFHTRGFRGAFFEGNTALFADYPEDKVEARGISRLDLQPPAMKQVLALGKPPEKETEDSEEGGKDKNKEKEKKNDKKKDDAQEDEGRTTQYGPYLLTFRPLKKGSFAFFENVRMDVKDVRTGNLLWSQTFAKEAPEVHVFSQGRTMVLLWPLSSSAAKNQINENPDLKRRLAAMKEKEGDYLLEVLDTGSGKSSGRLLIETGKGSFRISNAISAGDRVVVADTENRILVYSLADGELKARFFGAHATVNRLNGLLCAENETGKLTVYELSTLQKRDEFIFSSPVSWAQFSPDGAKLLVLTANQTAYVLVPNANANPTGASR